MKQFLLLIILLIILVSGGLFYNFFLRKTKVAEIISPSNPSTLTEISTSTDLSERDTLILKKEWYETKVETPKHNEVVRTSIDKIYKNWLKDAGVEKYKTYAEAKKDLSLFEDQKYFFYADYKLASSSVTDTFIYNITSYTGGAHGSATQEAYTFDKKGNFIPVNILLKDEKLAKIADYCYKDLIKQKRERMLSNGMSEDEINESLADDTWMREGTAAKRDNYSKVWFDGESLIIYFGQYQIGSYAEGDYTVTIPISNL